MFLDDRLCSSYSIQSRHLYSPAWKMISRWMTKRMRRILSSLCLQITIKCRELKQREEPQLTFAEVYRKFNVKKFGHEYDAKKCKTHQLGIYATRRIQELCCPTQQNFRKACYRRSAGSNGRLSAQTRQHRTHQKFYTTTCTKYAMAKQFMYKRLFILCRNHTG